MCRKERHAEVLHGHRRAEDAYATGGEAVFGEVMAAHQEFTAAVDGRGLHDPRGRGAAADGDRDLPARHPHRRRATGGQPAARGQGGVRRLLRDRGAGRRDRAGARQAVPGAATATSSCVRSGSSAERPVADWAGRRGRGDRGGSPGGRAGQPGLRRPGARGHAAHVSAISTSPRSPPPTPSCSPCRPGRGPGCRESVEAWLLTAARTARSTGSGARRPAAPALLARHRPVVRRGRRARADVADAALVGDDELRMVVLCCDPRLSRRRPGRADAAAGLRRARPPRSPPVSVCRRRRWRPG